MKNSTPKLTRGNSQRYCISCCNWRNESDMKTFDPARGWVQLDACKACLCRGRKSA